MKKTIFNLTIAIFLASTFNSCSKTKSKVFEEDKTFPFAKTGYANVIIDRETAEKYIGIYEDKIRRPVLGIINDKLSHAVWLDSAAINFLARYIKDSSQYQIDGVRVHFIAYDTIGTAPGQYKSHQLSFVIVPTKRNGTVTNPDGSTRYIHKDNWDVFTPLYLQYKNKFNGGLNHGELCPDYCPEQ